MALLPSAKRLNTKDFPPEEQKLVEQLAQILNDNIQSVYDALNKKLTFDDNFLGGIKDVEVTVDASGTPFNQTTIVTDIPKPRGIIVVKADNLTNSTLYPPGSPFVSFNIIQNGIQITNVTGLSPGYRYNLRLLTLG